MMIFGYTIRRLVLSACLASVAFLPGYAAGKTIIIEKLGAKKSAVDLSGLRHSGGKVEAVFKDTLARDLEMSGWFTVSRRGGGVIVVTGSCSSSRSKLVVDCNVSHKGTGRRFLRRTFKDKDRNARKLAHKVADEIVWAVKQVRGIASTQIALIGLRNGRKDVYVCDADGGNLTRITKEGAVCLFPAWHPDAGALVYTSFHLGFPDVFMINMDTMERTKIASFPGLNAGADISPDGRKMVLTLSKDGNPDLYIMDLKNKGLSRLTRTRFAAEASPSWSPGGRRIVFVSDKANSPQLYIMNGPGGKQVPITLRGRENVAPDWGPDGRIAYSSKRGRWYQICVINPDTGEQKLLTKNEVDHENPSWAPDGRHIVYTQTERFRSNLYILDTMGDRPLRLTTLEGDWYSPAWSAK